MIDHNRPAICRGTLTSGIDLEQVAAARQALAAMRETMPAPTPATEPELVSWRACVLAGLLIGALVWVVR
jgi:hypothetical protein